MKFHVVHIGKEGGRLGNMTLRKASEVSPALLQETPFSLTYTRGGLVPHLIPEVLERLAEATPVVFQAPLASQVLLQPVLEEFTRGYKPFAGLQGVLYSCNQDPMVATPSGYNDKQGIAVWPRSGRTQFDAAKFMSLQAVVRPDWLELLCDADTPQGASKKRQRKSLDRSLDLLDECLKLKDTHEALSGACVLAPLVGGHVSEDRKRYARGAATCRVHGYVLEALADGPATSELTSIEEITSLVADSLSEVSAELPRFLHGPWRPLHVLRLVQRGVDVFDSSYPCLATERDAALIFPLQLSSHNANSDVADRSNHPVEADRSRDASVADQQQSSDPAATTSPWLTAAYEITLRDLRYQDDAAPLVAGCTCYTCTRHTRAYIHHLITVNELLAPVLLQLHNLHHWAGFFASLRAAIADGGCLESLAGVFERLEWAANEADRGTEKSAYSESPPSSRRRRRLSSPETGNRAV